MIRRKWIIYFNIVFQKKYMWKETNIYYLSLIVHIHLKKYDEIEHKQEFRKIIAKYENGK